jgi:hypothetical protein
MQSKTVLWIATASTTVLAGAAALYGRVRTSAVDWLDKQGAFNSIRAERTESLKNLYGAETIAHARLDTEYPVNDPATLPQMNEINKRWWTQKSGIIHRKGADTFSGAWDALPSKAKTRALGFASVISVAAGGITYGLGHLFKSSPGRSDGGGDNSAGGYYGGGYWGGGDGGHHGGGHGGDCGGGFFGGGCGGGHGGF